MVELKCVKMNILMKKGKVFQWIHLNFQMVKFLKMLMLNI